MIAAAAFVVVLAIGFTVFHGTRSQGLTVAALRAAARLSPRRQREWIEAMIAEHDLIADDRTRRHFAMGCLWAVVCHGGRADSTAVVASGVVGLGAASAVVVAIYGLVEYPGVGAGWVSAVYLVVFGVLVAFYALAGFRLVRLGSGLARTVGLLAAAPAAVGAWWAARSDSVLSIGGSIVFVIPVAIAAGSVARRRRRADDGVVAASCGGVAAGFVTFLVYAVTTYATNGGPVTPTSWREFAQSGAHDYVTWAVGENLAGAVFLLLIVPVLATLLGLLAAKAAAPPSSTHSSP
jgi:hypothetical protein